MRYFSIAVISMLGIASSITSAQAETLQKKNWSGPYVGMNIGVTKERGATDVSTSDSFPSSYFTPPDPKQISAEADDDISQSSLAAGLFGGYGHQFDNLYLGVEASINSLGFDESHTSGAVYQSNPTGKFTNELSVKANWQATLRTRVGWAKDRWLAYVTGGVAATRITLDASFSDDYLGVGAAGQDSTKETKFGWVAGLGGEYALNDSWTIRTEYLYADFGKVDTSAFVTNPAFPTLGNNLKSSVDFRTQMLSVGFSYHF